jgi:hypothetical protein
MAVWWTCATPPWLISKLTDFVSYLEGQIGAKALMLPLTVVDDQSKGENFWAYMDAQEGFRAFPNSLTQSMFPLRVTIFSGGKTHPATIP